MSDQYIPPRTPTTVAGTDPYRTTTPGVDPYRTNVRVDVPPGPPPATGFSSGILVAAVFVVVAIIAAAVFSNRDMFGVGTGDAPGVSIENNAAPAPVAPSETVVDPVVPAAPADSAPTMVDPVAPATPVPDGTPVAPAAPANP